MYLFIGLKHPVFGGFWIDRRGVSGILRKFAVLIHNQSREK